MDRWRELGLHWLGTVAKSRHVSERLRLKAPHLHQVVIRVALPVDRVERPRGDGKHKGKITVLKIEPDTYYTPDEVCEQTGYAKSTLATQRSRGNGIPFTKLGSKPLYLGADILDHLRRNRRDFASQKPKPD